MNKKLSTKTFIISQVIILTISLAFLTGLYYILNLQHPISLKGYSLTRGPVTSKPASFILDLDQPDDNLLVFQPTIIISGKSLSSSPILIAGQLADRVIESKPDGNFSTIFSLQEGANQITVAIFDPTGEEKSVQRTIYYSKEKI